MVKSQAQPKKGKRGRPGSALGREGHGQEEGKRQEEAKAKGRPCFREGGKGQARCKGTGRGRPRPGQGEEGKARPTRGKGEDQAPTLKERMGKARPDRRVEEGLVFLLRGAAWFPPCFESVSIAWCCLPFVLWLGLRSPSFLLGGACLVSSFLLGGVAVFFLLFLAVLSSIPSVGW